MSKENASFEVPKIHNSRLKKGFIAAMLSFYIRNM